MNKDGLLGFVNEFYRAKQTNAVAMFLAERQTDLLSALLQLCRDNGVGIPERIVHSMAEVESLFKRIANINSLPINELLRFPPTVLEQPDKMTEYGTESFMPLYTLYILKEIARPECHRQRQSSALRT